ncbi:MAG TPA: hypothetical protein VES73_13885 [Lamprocystis sp. (in: g-proteobacteria)]|nr:hypothetical protein [Lamprocystis sp. (in: g-proteobacteria)]
MATLPSPAADAGFCQADQCHGRKYRLPDNRTQFYEVCSRAVLEEWDQTQSCDRANQFDRPHNPRRGPTA